MIDFAHLQIPFKMPKYNVGLIIVSLCVFGNVLAIDLTRLYGHHNKRELDAIGKFPAPIYIIYIYIYITYTHTLIRYVYIGHMDKINVYTMEVVIMKATLNRVYN